MPTLQEIEKAFLNARDGGHMDDARKLAAVILRERERRAADPDIELLERLPGATPGQVPVPSATQEETIGQQIVGAGEAALTTLTGATGGAVGMVGGTLKGIAKEILSGEFGSYEAAKRVEQEAIEGASALTYAPRTEAGQEYVETIGEVTAPLAMFPPVAAELQAAGIAARAGLPAASVKASQVAERVQPVVSKAAELPRRVAETVKTIPERIGISRESPETGRSVGAQQVPIGTVNREKARELDVPIELLKGQAGEKGVDAANVFEQQRFERETAKSPEGERIRNRYAEQNEKLVQNLDAFIDKTGAELTDKESIGIAIDNPLQKVAERERRKINNLYDIARKKGEMEDDVILSGIANHLNANVSLEGTVSSLKAIKDEALRLGLAAKDDEGQLVATPISLNDAELFRVFINDATNDIDTRQIRQAAKLKKIFDAETEGEGGRIYQMARKARAKFAKDFERTGLIRKMLGTKRGTDDRIIAIEQLLDRTVLQPSTSLDSMRKLRKLLLSDPNEGRQAWKEVKGGVLRHIRDKALESVQLDQRGNRVVSPAALDRVISQMDKSGKLDFIFGKADAEKLRVINDVAKVLFTSPPGVVNYSNTASVLAGLIDVIISGTSGIPAPIASSLNFLKKSIKDRKLKARIDEALGE